MKDTIKEIIVPGRSKQFNENLVREYLQKYVLFILYGKKYLRELVFTGGTALRVIHGLKRFSEDLDFSLYKKAKEYDFVKLLNALERELELSGYTVVVTYNDKKTVHNTFLKFPDLFYDLKLSPRKNEKLSIKLEIDTNPPMGGNTNVTLHNSVFMFHLLHFDISSLFAGKIHALLTRQYVKGRDYYDLVWYLTKFKNINPNFLMLNNALRQTEKKPKEINEQNWRTLLADKISNTDMATVVKDVEPLLEEPQEVDLLKKDVILKCLDVGM